MLTGTPLQNNLEELFNLMLFLTKQSSSLLFSDQTVVKQSNSLFPTKQSSTIQRFPSIEEFESETKDLTVQEKVAHLHRMLSPYVLRRLKKDADVC
jgi:chromodomain-helicase-DNA-binding protein 4